MEELVRVIQLPIVEERLREWKAYWEEKAKEAVSLVCTTDTITSVKKHRADLTKEFKELEKQKMAVKTAIFAPWNAAEATYKECVTDLYKAADDALKRKIDDLENEIKKQCEDGLREYFAELCAVRHLDWLEYERSGIKVDMASAKAKTPKRLREQIANFVTAVGDAVDRIMLLDNADEIMVEFKRTLDAGQAICTVQERHRRIEEEREKLGVRQEQKAVEDISVARVEALAPPVVKPQENTIKVSLLLYPTRTQFEEKIMPLMRQLKEICDADGIRYE